LRQATSRRTLPKAFGDVVQDFNRMLANHFPVRGELQFCAIDLVLTDLRSGPRRVMFSAMRESLILVAHLVVTIIKLAAPGGAPFRSSRIANPRASVAHPESIPEEGINAWCGGARAARSRHVTDGSLSPYESRGRHQPATLLRFHRALVRRKYRLLFSGKPRCCTGPKGPSEELIAVVLEMKRRNPRVGRPRIASQVSHAFGAEIDKDVVRRILAKALTSEARRRGPSWLTLIAAASDSYCAVNASRAADLRHFVWQSDCAGSFHTPIPA
jgi:hypothetical protein